MSSVEHKMDKLDFSKLLFTYEADTNGLLKLKIYINLE